MPRLTAALLTIAVLSITLPARAQSDAGRTLTHSVVLAAPADEVWRTLTTPDGWKNGFGVALAEIDLRVGGAIRTHYDPNGALGDPNTIVHTILAYEPGRMIASKCTAVPAGAPDALRHISERGWSVIRLDPLTPSRTRLTITGMGYDDSALGRQAYDFFKAGNDHSLKKLQQHFADPADDKAVADTEALMHRLIGEWAFSTTGPDGAPFRGHTVVSPIYGGKVIHARGEIGDDKALHPHAFMLAARDPRSGAYKVWNFNEKANYTEGEARADGDNRLVVDWHTWTAADGSFIPYHVEYTFTGPDSYHFEVHAPAKETGELRRIVAVDFTRVEASAPTNEDAE